MYRPSVIHGLFLPTVFRTFFQLLEIPAKIPLKLIFLSPSLSVTTAKPVLLIAFVTASEFLPTLWSNLTPLRFFVILLISVNIPPRPAAKAHSLVAITNPEIDIVRIFTASSYLIKNSRNFPPAIIKSLNILTKSCNPFASSSLLTRTHS